MLLHDLVRVVDILNRVLSFALFDHDRFRNALLLGIYRHRMRLNELVVCGSASHDDDGSNTCLPLPDAFKHSFSLLRRRCSIIF